MHVYQKPFLSGVVPHHRPNIEVDDTNIITVAPPFQRRKRAAIFSNDFLPTAMEISTLVSGVAVPTLFDQGGEMQGQNPVQATTGTPQEGAKADANILKDLLAECESDVAHEGLMDVFRSQKYVGMVDSCRSLVQAGTRLYLLDLSTLTRDMFYQQALRCCNSFATFTESIALTPPPSIKGLTLMALEGEEAGGRWEDSDEGGTKEEVADLLSQLLVQKSKFLQELFGIQVNQEGHLLALPRLIDHYIPNPIALPSFVLGLGQRVDWGETVQCASDVAVLLAELYRLHSDNELYGDLETLRGENDDNGVKERQKQLEWEVEHVLLPALRLFLKPSKERASDGSVVELTRLERLYRVFERC